MEEHKDWTVHPVLQHMLARKRSGVEGAWYCPAGVPPRTIRNHVFNHVFKMNGKYYASPSNAMVSATDTDVGPFDTFEAAATCATVLP